MAASGPMAKRWAYFEFLKTLHGKLDFMKYQEGGREVQFGHVPRETNIEADWSANRALDESFGLVW
jgi:hypothetical protein